ncbi:MAG TPA: pilus assembly protein TadG-related protein [Micromonosporaceae bacterium]|jgi:Flp pilus assembly protein TadG|nr:pilus assembly protein TadG-related protein [Micromonosporaceae bacterium]
MSWLNRWRTGDRPRRRGRERGGIAAIVSILLAGGVLLGTGALAVDVGKLYVEREELQSGADAAAVAVAEACARSITGCQANAATLAGRYADANAKDQTSAVSAVCGRTGGLPGCPTAAANLTACIGNPPATGAYVEVHTSTKLPDGTTLLPPTLAQTLLGHRGFQGVNVAACARAAWGAPRTGWGLGLTISTCEWQANTSGGTTFAAPPPYPPNPLPAATFDMPVKLHANGATTCPAGPSGWDAPGGFGWLNDPDQICSTLVAVDGTYGGSTGTSSSQACQTRLTQLRDAHEVVLMPVYDGVKGTGAGTTYHLAGMAAFVLTGYHLPSLKEKSWLTGRHYCAGEQWCVYGYFTHALIPAGSGELGGPELGASIVTAIG